MKRKMALILAAVFILSALVPVVLGIMSLI